MNGFFIRWRLMAFELAVAAASIVVIFGYLALALRPPRHSEGDMKVVQRGSILDRTGKPLAVQKNFYHFVVTPSMVKNPAQFAKAVAPVLGQRAENIASEIANASNPNFLYLAKKMEQAQYEELKRLSERNKWNFVRFDKMSGRFYPEGSLASQMIGFMGDDGRGLTGVELSQDSLLSPDAKDGATETFGENIYLTIDVNLQHRLMKVMESAQERTQAESMMLVAADAKSGELLSYISYPSADLNHYGAARKEQTVDRPSVWAYEPGSVFKIFSMATFLNSGVISDSDTFVCDGHYDRELPSGEVIRINCTGAHGVQTAREALKYSCNDALAQMSDRISTEAFLSGVKKFGFGERTRIELPGETGGIIKSTSDSTWSARTKATMAIGQELTVNALQIVQAASALANGGRPAQLTCISKISDHDGAVRYVHAPKYKEPVFSASTARRLLSYMATTAQTGTGSKAALGDISIGVKTGTAQMADTVHGGYSENDFVSNCVAIFPVEDPEIILYIVMVKAKGETYAGRIVAPVIGEAADIIIDHMGMTRASAASLAHSGRISIGGIRIVDLGSVMPDFTGYSKREIFPLVEREDVSVLVKGEGHVVSQSPPPGTPITQGMKIELFLE